MATTIIRTAHSTVVRDGMDFSSALCDASGETVAQAVSVPVPSRLDPDCDGVAARATTGIALLPGDVFIMNDPFDGGMHLQDIFVVKPVHLDGRPDRLGCHDRPPRRRRRAAARIERLRQHGDLPGGAPDALAPVLRRGRAGRRGAQADRGEHADPAHDLRRPWCAGRCVLRGRARTTGARRASRARRSSRS